MPLQPQTIDIPFKSGLDQATDKHADPSGFLQLQDAVWLGEGAVRQRHGFRDVSATALPTDAPRSAQLLEAATGLRWAPALPESRYLAASSDQGRSTRDVDVAVVTRASGDKVLVVFSAGAPTTGNNTIPYLQVLSADGKPIKSYIPDSGLLPFGSFPRVLCVDAAKVGLFALDVDTGVISVKIYDIDDLINNTPSAVSFSVISTADVFDSASNGAGRLWVGYLDGSDAKVRAYGVNGTPVTTAFVVGTGASYVPDRISISYRPTLNEVWVALWAVGELPATVQCDDQGQQSNYAEVPGVTEEMGHDQDGVFLNWSAVGSGVLILNRARTYEGDSEATQRDNGGPYSVNMFQLGDSALLSPADWAGFTADRLTNFHALTHAFQMPKGVFSTTAAYTETWYVVGMVGHNASADYRTSSGSTALQYPAVVLVELETGRAVAKLVHDNAPTTFLNPWRYHSASVLAESDDSVSVVVAVPVQLSPDVAQSVVLRVDSANLGVSSRANVAGISIKAGAQPWMGAQYPAHGVAQVAEPYPAILSTSGTGLTGTYRVLLRHEYVDQAGNIWLGPLSVSNSIVLANQGIVVKYQANPLPVASDYGFFTPFAVLVYRTAANGSTYFLRRREMVSSADTTVTLSTDTDADATLGEALDVATVDSEPIPPLSHVWSHRNRLFGVRSDSLTEVVYTTEFVPPSTPRWNAALSLQVLGEGGRVVAGASMDDKLILFQETAVRYTSGFGPDNTGSNGSFGLPELIPGGAGVDYANRNSVVTTDQGVLFRHAAGIGLITRKLEVNLAFGESVRDVIAGYNIRRAEWLPSQRQVWFLLETAAGAMQSTILVYDCRFGRWLTFTLVHKASDVISHGGVVYVVAQSAGSGSNKTFYLLKYDPATYADEMKVAAGTGSLVETYIEPSITTPWFRGGGRGAMARVWRILVDGRWQSARDLELTTYTQDAQRDLKHAETADDTLLEVSTHLGDSAGEQFSADFRPLRQRCTAMKLKLTVVDPSEGGGDPDTEGLVLTNVRILYGAEAPKGKTAKKTATKP